MLGERIHRRVTPPQMLGVTSASQLYLETEVFLYPAMYLENKGIWLLKCSNLLVVSPSSPLLGVATWHLAALLTSVLAKQLQEIQKYPVVGSALFTWSCCYIYRHLVSIVLQQWDSWHKSELRSTQERNKNLQDNAIPEQSLENILIGQIFIFHECQGELRKMQKSTLPSILTSKYDWFYASAMIRIGIWIVVWELFQIFHC